MRSRQEYEDQGYADMAISRSHRLTDCPYRDGWQRDAWQTGAWRWMRELRAKIRGGREDEGKPGDRQDDRQVAREVGEILAGGPAVDVSQGPAPRGSPRSSVRLVRSRRAAIRDYNRLVAERPEGPAGDEAARWFVQGFEFIRREVLAGRDPEQAHDLSTSVRGSPVAFHDGASAARSLYNSRRPELAAGTPRSPEIARADRAQAERLAKAYHVRLPD